MRWIMSLVEDVADVDRLLDAAVGTVGRVRYCWLITDAGDGAVRTRPMGRLPADAGDDPWLMRFLTDGHSPKAADMRREPRVSVIFDDDPRDAYVAVAGKVRLIEDRAEVCRRWLRRYEAYFPDGPERSSAIFLAVEVSRIELWIKGVTPEPFGLKTTVLERDEGRRWRRRA
jgi:general stress protein 26